MNQNLKQGGISIRTWSRSRLLVEARACFFSIFFLVSAFSAFSGGVPVGTVVAYAKAADPPEGWLRCWGDEVLTNQWPELFAVIGYTYGSAGGGQYFKLPDMRGRVIVCEDYWASPQKSAGCTGGLERVTLTIAEMPSHNHTHAGFYPYSPPAYAGPSAGSWCNWIDVPSTYVGGGAAHENMPPYLVVNYIIKAVPDEQESFFGDLEEIELWNLKIGLWIFGGLCAVIASVCFFLRR